jgi:hypothetical protein
LNGQKIITLPTVKEMHGQEIKFDDQGATCLDPIDGNLTVIEQGADEIPTDTPGTFIIKYMCENEAKIAAVPVTRTVIITAPTPKTLKPLSDKAVIKLVGGSVERIAIGQSGAKYYLVGGNFVIFVLANRLH